MPKVIKYVTNNKKRFRYKNTKPEYKKRFHVKKVAIRNLVPMEYRISPEVYESIDNYAGWLLNKYYKHLSHLLDYCRRRTATGSDINYTCQSVEKRTEY